jgi:hypothetical protein
MASGSILSIKSLKMRGVHPIPCADINIFQPHPTSSPMTALKLSPSENLRQLRLLIGVASTVWLIAAAVAGHFVWQGVPWIVVLLLAAMAELIVLTAWLLGSVFHEPAQRWDLPPNPADAQKGWRGTWLRSRAAAAAVGDAVRQKVLRRPAKT